MKRHEIRVYPFSGAEIREDGDGVLAFQGYAAVFDELSEPLWDFREQIAPGAFDKTLSESPDVRMLINHEGIPVARTKSGTLALSLDEHGLHTKAGLDPANPRVQELGSALRRKDLDQMSFGFWTIRDEWATEKGQTIRTLKEVSLEDGDVSPVSFPAYKGTSAEIRRALRSLLISNGRLDLRSPVASHSTPTSDDAWDGPANEARLSNDAGQETYRKAFAWNDPDADPDTKAAWRFIHHEVSEEGSVGAANMMACSSAIGVLNGGRGGTTIPDADREGVWEHLARHMRDADMEPPELQDAGGRSLPGDLWVASEPGTSPAIMVPSSIDLREAIAEVREAKVLSAKNRELVSAAIEALSALLSAADGETKSSPLQAYSLEVEILEQLTA